MDIHVAQLQEHVAKETRSSWTGLRKFPPLNRKSLLAMWFVQMASLSAQQETRVVNWPAVDGDAARAQR